jgi:hypothetical protein
LASFFFLSLFTFRFFFNFIQHQILSKKHHPTMFNLKKKALCTPLPAAEPKEFLSLSLINNKDLSPNIKGSRLPSL